MKLWRVKANVQRTTSEVFEVFAETAEEAEQKVLAEDEMSGLDYRRENACKVLDVYKVDEIHPSREPLREPKGDAPDTIQLVVKRKLLGPFVREGAGSEVWFREIDLDYETR